MKNELCPFLPSLCVDEQCRQLGELAHGSALQGVHGLRGKRSTVWLRGSTSGQTISAHLVNFSLRRLKKSSWPPTNKWLTTEANRSELTFSLEWAQRATSGLQLHAISPSKYDGWFP